MSGINKAIILGNVGQDPEIRFLPDGTAVANLSIATSEQWKDKNTGQKQERTEWHRCNAFGKLAEIIQQYVKKGSKLYIEGSIHTRKWQDSSGADRYSTEIKIKELQMLDRKSDSNQQPSQSQQPQNNQGLQQAPQQQNQQPMQNSGPAGDQTFEDDLDIPF